MSDSWVTSVRITNTGQLELNIQVDGFEPGRNVEISGQATQSGGAFANFYEIKPVPDKPNVPDLNNPNVSHYSVDVLTDPLPPHKFREDQDVSVVLRVSKVWLTVLGAHREPSSVIEPPGSVDTTWDKISRYSDLDGRSADGKIMPPNW
jgi:hypothetical protein